MIAPEAKATPAQAEAPRHAMRKMADNEWYFDCEGVYIDVAKDAQGKLSIFVRERGTEKEAWLDQPEAKSAPAMGEELPPLPACDVIAYSCIGENDAYSANAVRAYGRACMALRQPGGIYMQRLAELLKGLEASALLVDQTPEFLFKLGQMIATQAKKAPDATAPVSQPAAQEPVTGDILPPVGSTVQIHLARQDEWVDHTVTGYYAWPDLGGNPALSRVFVRVVDANGLDNARLLCDVRHPAAPQPLSAPAGSEQPPVTEKAPGSTGLFHCPD